jgi:hypothetical protein
MKSIKFGIDFTTLEWAGQWWQVFGWFGLAYGVEHHFQQYFNYIMMVSFNGGGNHQPVCKSLTTVQLSKITMIIDHDVYITKISSVFYNTFSDSINIYQRIRVCYLFIYFLLVIFESWTVVSDLQHMEIMEMTELSCTEALEWAGQWWQVFGWFGLAYGVEHHFQQYFPKLHFFLNRLTRNTNH